MHKATVLSLLRWSY